jgi:hypothetical protein
MVKAKATMHDGRVAIVMGISQANVDRLKQGQPIYFDPAALHIAPGATIGGITLFYGETDALLADSLKALIGPDTEVIDVPRGDDRPQ